MGSNTAKLEQLRPVIFHLKSDPNGALQYGLIAEEVAKVYPELVIRDEKGRIDGVRYDELAPLLLNEVQQQAAEIRDLKKQQRTVGELQKELAEMHAALLKVQANNEGVAQR
jgi:Chaperone of endosialidase